MTQRQLRVTVDLGQDHVSVPEEQAVLLFQSVRELLMNVAKHAGTKHASVHLRCEDRGIRLEVRDAGAGFDLSVVRPQDGGQPLKFGLFSIRERMKAFGGRLELVTAPGKGTSALLVLPLDTVVDARVVWRVDGAVGPASGLIPKRVTRTPASVLQKALTVLLVDDHAMMRQGLRSVLEAHPDIQIVGEASDGQEAV